MEKNKIFKISDNANPNYLATICRIKNRTPIPGADNLMQTVVNGYNIIISKDMYEGQFVVYFPLESVICEKYLSINNSYSEAYANLNSNYNDYLAESDISIKKSMCGFFNKTGRVRIIKLRGVYSQGFIAPIETIFSLLNTDPQTIDWRELVGTQFDTINDTLICKKFIPNIPIDTTTSSQKHHNKDMKKLARFDRIIPGQFEFHYDTTMLAEHMNMLSPEDYVDITVKLHGSSIVMSNILCNRKLSKLEKIKKFMHLKVNETKYGNIYSSHHKIKNRYLDDNPAGFYGHDIWKPVNEMFKSIIPEGMTIYGEIVGYVEGTDQYIQKNHDYGCSKGCWKFMPYRVTETDKFGNKIEWDMDKVIKFAMKLFANDLYRAHIMVPTLVYEGYMKDLYPEIPIDENWHDNVLSAMKNDKDRFGMELNEPLCINKVPREGIVIRKRGDKIAEAWKLKTNAHYALESKQHDNGEADIEEVS